MRCNPRLRSAPHAARRAAVLLVVAALLEVARAHASPSEPTGTVTGRIVRSDGPKYDVHVIDQATWKIVTTQRDGTFRFEHVGVGDHVFRIGSDYCEGQLIPVTVHAGQVSTI